VSDPTKPNEVGTYPIAKTPEAVAISGKYAYVACWDIGLRVIDVSDPAHPVGVGFYDTGDDALGVAISGSTAYVADGFDGLYILDCSPALPVMLQSLDLSSNAQGVRIDWEMSDETKVASYEIYRARAGEGMGRLVLTTSAAGQGRYEMTDTDVLSGESYLYTLGAVKEDGARMILGTRKVIIGAPSVLSLEQNVPNPFNPTTEIEVHLPEAIRVELTVYDIRGRLVATIFSGFEAAGVKRYTWTGQDNEGTPVARGIYFCRLRAGKRTLSRRMVLLR